MQETRYWKTEIIEELFDQRWDEDSRTLSDPEVTLADVSAAIRGYNARHPENRKSDRNPANFFKDLVRRQRSFQRYWPTRVIERGYTGQQQTGENRCFVFVPLGDADVSTSQGAISTEGVPVYQIESVSLPLASRRLGRSDEPWLVQVLVRLRVLETHFSVVSQRRVIQMDHLQMSVKRGRTEIDALFLVVEDRGQGTTEEAIVCCEAKGRNEDVVREQVLREVKEVFRLPGVTQRLAIPLAVKAFAPSKILVIEFEAVSRESAQAVASLTVATQAVYELVPPVPGVGV